jgi:Holliday junction resolvasome RuvABC endonuclease subunit
VLRTELCKVWQHDHCELMVLENQERAWQGRQQAGETNAKATLARVGEGIARGFASQFEMEVLELEPSEIRAAFGLPRRSTKEQLATLALRRLRFPPADGSNHAKDALAAAIAGGARYSVLSRLKAGGR